MMTFKTKKEKADYYSLRIKITKIGFLILFLILFSRLYDLEINKYGYYKSLYLKQHGQDGSAFDRGNIYFTTKDGELVGAAVNKQGYILAINPQIMVKGEESLQKINKIIKVDDDIFLKKVSKKEDPFEIIAHRLNKDEADKIRILQKEIKGLILTPESWRFYPAQNLASHVLGFVGYEKNELNGRYGVEKYYDEYLKGGINRQKKSFLGTLLDLGQQVFLSREATGDALILNIEPMLQSVLETNLEKAYEKYNAASASGIIINPQDGKVLALAALPDFNPNEYSKVKNISVFSNPIVENIFEVGSVFKPLTLAMAIDQNVITPETTYYDKGYIILNNKKIENYDGKARGKINMQTVLNKSLNTGAVFAQQTLGKERFKSYIINYGLAEKTNIDLPNEVVGKIENLNSNRDVEFATASFGQGIAVSPIEFAIAVSSIVNGGKIVEPHVANRIISNAKNYSFHDLSETSENKKDAIIINDKIKRNVIKPESSETINRMLTKVVDEALVEGAVKMEHYSVGAKTGTAQRVKAGGNEYGEEYLHTFFGYAPSFEPKFLIFLLLQKPVGAKYASQTLTAPFMDILKFILNYYKISPDR